MATSDLQLDAMSTFRYDRPDNDKAKTVVWLAKTDRMWATIQVVRKGGETNVHSHPHLDGIWYVLKGKARFYSDETTLLAELGPQEGVMIPRGVKYWFESASDEPLEIFQVEASDVPFKSMNELMNDRIDFTPVKGEAGSGDGQARFGRSAFVDAPSVSS